MRIGLAGSVGEQRHRLRPARIQPGRRRRAGSAAPAGTGPPRPRPAVPAGRQHSHIVRCRQQPGAQRRGRADHVLAVIQHQQQLLPCQRPAPPPRPAGRWAARASLALPPLPRELCRVVHLRQLGQPRPVREPPRHRPATWPASRVLPTPPGPVTVTSRCCSSRSATSRHRTGPADKTRQLGRETMHATGHGDRRGHPHTRTISAGRSRRTGKQHRPQRGAKTTVTN